MYKKTLWIIIWLTLTLFQLNNVFASDWVFPINTFTNITNPDIMIDYISWDEIVSFSNEIIHVGARNVDSINWSVISAYNSTINKYKNDWTLDLTKNIYTWNWVFQKSFLLTNSKNILYYGITNNWEFTFPDGTTISGQWHILLIKLDEWLNFIKVDLMKRTEWITTLSDFSQKNGDYYSSLTFFQNKLLTLRINNDFNVRDIYEYDFPEQFGSVNLDESHIAMGIKKSDGTYTILTQNLITDTTVSSIDLIDQSLVDMEYAVWKLYILAKNDLTNRFIVKIIELDANFNFWVINDIEPLLWTTNSAYSINKIWNGSYIWITWFYNGIEAPIIANQGWNEWFIYKMWLDGSFQGLWLETTPLNDEILEIKAKSSTNSIAIDNSWRIIEFVDRDNIGLCSNWTETTQLVFNTATNSYTPIDNTWLELFYQNKTNEKLADDLTRQWSINWEPYNMAYVLNFWFNADKNNDWTKEQYKTWFAKQNRVSAAIDWNSDGIWDTFNKALLIENLKVNKSIANRNIWNGWNAAGYNEFYDKNGLTDSIIDWTNPYYLIDWDDPVTWITSEWFTNESSNQFRSYYISARWAHWETYNSKWYYDYNDRVSAINNNKIQKVGSTYIKNGDYYPIVWTQMNRAYNGNTNLTFFPIKSKTEWNKTIWYIEYSCWNLACEQPWTQWYSCIPQANKANSCWNWIIEYNLWEQCDGSNIPDYIQQEYGNAYTLSCNSACMLETTPNPIYNPITSTSEVIVEITTCKADPSSRCNANWVVDAGEECDPKLSPLTCSNNCEITANSCWNGIIDYAKWEICDDWNSIDSDSCSNQCLSNPIVSCWDGIVQSLKDKQKSNNRLDDIDETCDWGFAKNWTGEVRFWKTCNSACKIEIISSEWYCWDNVLNPDFLKSWEECEIVNWNIEFTAPWIANWATIATHTCNSSCKVTPIAQVCWDLRVTWNEECDGWTQCYANWSIDINWNDLSCKLKNENLIEHNWWRIPVWVFPSRIKFVWDIIEKRESLNFIYDNVNSIELIIPDQNFNKNTRLASDFLNLFNEIENERYYIDEIDTRNFTSRTIANHQYLANLSLENIYKVWKKDIYLEAKQWIWKYTWLWDLTTRSEGFLEKNFKNIIETKFNSVDDFKEFIGGRYHAYHFENKWVLVININELYLPNRNYYLRGAIEPLFKNSKDIYLFENWLMFFLKEEL